jgi:hypothetical protein
LGAAAGASGKVGRAAEVDAEALAGMRLRTAGEVMQVIAPPLSSVFAFVEDFGVNQISSHTAILVGARRHQSQTASPHLLRSFSDSHAVPHVPF